MAPWLRAFLDTLGSRLRPAPVSRDSDDMGQAGGRPLVVGVAGRHAAPAPIIYQGTARYPVHEVVLHTSATAADWHKGKTAEQMMAEIRLWHTRDNGWQREGYHGLIAPDGSWADGRPFTMIGAHVRERNRGTLGIVLVPVRWVDGRKIGRFEDYYTEAQRRVLKAKLRAISAMTELKWVTGHNDYAAKTCPGFHVNQEDWL